MRSARTGLLGTAVLLLVGGCPALLNQTSVQLVNTTAFPVQVRIFIGDSTLTIGALLTQTGTELNFVVPAGQTLTFSRDCNTLQAIIIDRARLDVLGTIGPEENTGVLREGSDFNCGDTIVFTFSANLLNTDLSIQHTVIPRPF